MRVRNVFLLFVALLATLAAASSAVAGDPPKFLAASGQEVTFAVLDPGAVTCIGGTATGDLYWPCDGSHRIFIKHQTVQTMLYSADGPAVPLLAGVSTMTVDCSLDGNLAGSCWGTFEWDVDGASKWLGVVNGSFDFSDFTFDYQMVGIGVGGVVDGMQLRYDCHYPGGYSFIGDFTARVHTPKS